MVNSEEFIKRLEVLLEYYAISASVFADTIGVQRSGLSHLLSGRNKPSLDFIMKIVENYPEVDLYWLLNGKGSFPFNKSASEQPAPSPVSKKQPEHLDLFSIDEANAEDFQRDETSVTNTASALSGKIERIVVFYTDGTFKSYNPQQ